MEKQMETNPNAIEVVADVDKLNTVHADMIQIETSNDYIIINFLQTYPNAMPAKNPNEPKPAKMAKIASRVALPWAHMAKALPVLAQAIKATEEVAEKNYKEAKEISEKIKLEFKENE